MNEAKGVFTRLFGSTRFWYAVLTITVDLLVVGFQQDLELAKLVTLVGAVAIGGESARKVVEEYWKQKAASHES